MLFHDLDANSAASTVVISVARTKIIKVRLVIEILMSYSSQI